MNIEKFPWFSSYDPKTPHNIVYPEVPIHWFMENAALRFGTRPCCSFKDTVIAYREMDAVSKKLANYLLSAGLQAGERVALILPNCPQFVLAFYAISRAGGVVVAINPAYKQAELLFQLRDSGASIVIAIEPVYELVRSIQAETNVRHIILTTLEDEAINFSEQTPKMKPGEGVTWLQNCLAEPPQAMEFPSISPDSPLIFQYSGGTTGIPKAAIGTHRNLVANTLQFRAWLGELTDGDETVLAAIPLFHVYGMVIAMSLGVALSAKLVLIPDPRDLTHILQSIDCHQATLFPGVPTMFQTIVQTADVLEGKYRLKSIKACISGSAPLLPDVKQRFEAITGGKLLEGYGLSEAPTATHCNPMLGKNRTGSIGLPLPDVVAKIVDIDTGVRTLAVGESGELILRGPQVMMAYHNHPDETQLTLRNGWLFTGDIAKMDKEGYFYLVGRKKEMIKVGGFQVWPREVEEVIASHHAVMECAVAGVPDRERVEMVKAWVVTRKGSALDAEEIKHWCEERIARYKIPAEVEIIDKLPRTTVGKLLKRELIRLHQEKTKE